MEEAVGVLRAWHRCDSDQARRWLAGQPGRDGADVEATRVARIVNAAASARTDPELD
jgi:hypothetical protein